MGPVYSMCWHWFCRFFTPWYLYILDGNPEHVAHAWGRRRSFRRKFYLGAKLLYERVCPLVTHKLTEFFVCILSLKITILNVLCHKKCFRKMCFRLSLTWSVSLGCNFVYMLAYTSKTKLFTEIKVTLILTIFSIFLTEFLSLCLSPFLLITSLLLTVRLCFITHG